MLYYLCRLYISLLLSDKEFTDALRSYSSYISLLLILQASYVSYVVAELVQCLFVGGFVGFGVFCFVFKTNTLFLSA